MQGRETELSFLTLMGRRLIPAVIFHGPGKRTSSLWGTRRWGVKALLERLMPDEGAERISEARERFLEYYWDHLNVKTFLYPGVLETLRHFKQLNKKMAVVTNKPIKFTERLLEELALKGFFMMALGGDSLPNRKPHPEPIEKVIATLGILRERTVFVGDSPIDCETGKRAGIAPIGARTGSR